MLEPITTIGKKIWDTIEYYKVYSKNWFRERAYGAHAKAWLIFLSFSEVKSFMIGG